MLINPDKMKLVYKGVKFNLFEFERGYAGGLDSRVQFFSPICAKCMCTYGFINEDKQHISNNDDIAVNCGVEDCDNKADFFISFDFGFEEGDVEEEIEEVYSGWEDLYEYSELKFD